MPRISQIFGVLAVLTALLIAATPGLAKHIFVSQFGNDTSGNGTPNAPFKTLQKAIDQAQDSDVIQLEMGGDYGPGNITNKSLTIMSTEGGGIYEPGIAAIRFTGGPLNILTLIGLTIDQGGSGFNGIVFNAGLKLIMLDMLIQNASGGAIGVFFQPNTNSELHIRDTAINNFGTSGNGGGIRIVPRNSADVIGSIINCTMLNNLVALYMLAAANSFNDMIVDPSYLGGNGNAITSSGTGSVVRVRDTVIANNTGTALNHPNNGKIISLGGNSVVDNATKGTFTDTVPQE